MYRSLLVPLDGSGFAEQALPVALGLALRAGATLHLVHVHTPHAPPSALEDPGDRADPADGTPQEAPSERDPAGRALREANSQLKEAYRSYLDGVSRRLAALATVPVLADLVEGAVGDALAEEARVRGADLIVMATHGRGPLSRFWLGSVADEMVRRSPVPVLLLRPRGAAADLAEGPVFKHVLIPLDGSALAEQVLEPALALGGLMQARYTLLRVVVPALLPGPDPTGYGLVGPDDSVLEGQQREARGYLEGVAVRLRARSGVVQTRAAVGQQPAVAILEEARALGADLIALETHGRGGLARLLLGSVADKVLRGALSPVLVHRSAAQPGAGP
jgi:nucleotide-binding universal stress UspA family protein